MKMHIWLSALIAGMLLGMPVVDAPAELIVNSTGGREMFVINSEPSFVYLRTQGFSISIGSPYDIFYYGNRYYLNNHGRWYRSYSYRGPWYYVVYKRLPSRIRRHRLEDIRRYRDIEYRKHDSRNNRYQRNDDNRRRVLEQKFKSPESRTIKAQPKRVLDNRKMQHSPMRAPESRKQPEKTNRSPEGWKAQEPPKGAPDGRKVHQNKMRAPEGRTEKDQSTRAPEGKKSQGDQDKGDNRGGKKGKTER